MSKSLLLIAQNFKIFNQPPGRKGDGHYDMISTRYKLSVKEGHVRGMLSGRIMSGRIKYREIISGRFSRTPYSFSNWNYYLIRYNFGNFKLLTGILLVTLRKVLIRLCRFIFQKSKWRYLRGWWVNRQNRNDVIYSRDATLTLPLRM